MIPRPLLLRAVVCACSGLIIGAIGLLAVDQVGATRAAYVDGEPSASVSFSAVAVPDLCATAGFRIGSGFNNVIIGTSGADELEGTSGPDLILGLDGDDEIHGLQQDDCIDGGAGNDQLYGEAGRDVVLGGGGDDTLDGGNAKDYLFGGAGDDTLVGTNGPDILDGGAGTDRICVGGRGPDSITNCETIG